MQLHKNRITDEELEVNPKIKQEMTTIFYKDLKPFQQYDTIKFSVKLNKETKKYECIEETTKFVKVWEHDQEMKAYQTLDFLPTNKTESELLKFRQDIKDAEVFNMFCGYNDLLSTTKLPLKPDGQVDEDKVLKVTELWRDIVLNLVEGNEEYYELYVNWISQHLINPSNKLGISVILEGQQGSGKNLHLKPIAKIVGARHFLDTCNIDDILGTHAEGVMNKLWIVLNELEGRDTMDFEGQLKSFVTEDTKTVNVKFMRPTEVQNYTNVLITTNKKNCIHIDVMSGNRRWMAFRSTEKYAFQSKLYTKNQWEQIQQRFNVPKFIVCLYYYLTKIIDGTKYKFGSIPQTEALKTLINYSRSSVLFWFEEFLMEKDYKHMKLKQEYIIDNQNSKNKRYIDEDGDIQEYDDDFEIDDRFFYIKFTSLFDCYKKWADHCNEQHPLDKKTLENKLKDASDLGIISYHDSNWNQKAIKFHYKYTLEKIQNFNKSSSKEQNIENKEQYQLFQDQDLEW
jgi:phage/plasmid-associated DNA primase